MEVSSLFIGADVLGGLARGFFGLLKVLGGGFAVKPGYFMITVVMSACIGGLLGLVFDVDLLVAGLAGYVDTDILENIFKSSMEETILLRKK